jgi:anti-sigma B factor antagonist
MHGQVLIVLLTEARLTNDATMKALGTELVNLMNTKCEHGKMLVNFEPVKFMSSAMLGQLVTLHKQCKTAKVELKFCSISPDIMQVFTLTRLDKLFDIQTTEANALAAFEGKSTSWW